jgi:hypothetical protein
MNYSKNNIAHLHFLYTFVSTLGVSFNKYKLKN